MCSTVSHTHLINIDDTWTQYAARTHTYMSYTVGAPPGIGGKYFVECVKGIIMIVIWHIAWWSFSFACYSDTYACYSDTYTFPNGFF